MAKNLFELDERARAAKELLDNVMLTAALDAMKQEAIDAITTPGHALQLPEIIGQIKAVDEIRRRLQAVVDDPKMYLHALKVKKITGGDHGRA